MQVLTQLEVMNANIQALREDIKELGGKGGHLEVDVEWIIQNHLYDCP